MNSYFMNSAGNTVEAHTPLNRHYSEGVTLEQ
ncbi:hypothetical protein MNBD_ALPHA05-133 [hydrothermal vent metagenome]|uniref:Uncharacterized protein n=1 Tax=hydrothermal vent metagenome TaxID=652676 RepID=A0A3B0TK40_9ZZZZ